MVPGAPRPCAGAHALGDPRPGGSVPLERSSEPTAAYGSTRIAQGEPTTETEDCELRIARLSEAFAPHSRPRSVGQAASPRRCDGGPHLADPHGKRAHLVLERTGIAQSQAAPIVARPHGQGSVIHPELVRAGAAPSFAPGMREALVSAQAGAGAPPWATFVTYQGCRGRPRRSYTIVAMRVGRWGRTPWPTKVHVAQARLAIDGRVDRVFASTTHAFRRDAATRTDVCRDVVDSRVQEGYGPTSPPTHERVHRTIERCRRPTDRHVRLVTPGAIDRARLDRVVGEDRSVPDAPQPLSRRFRAREVLNRQQSIGSVWRDLARSTLRELLHGLLAGVLPPESGWVPANPKAEIPGARLAHL